MNKTRVSLLFVIALVFLFGCSSAETNQPPPVVPDTQAAVEAVSPPTATSLQLKQATSIPSATFASTSTHTPAPTSTATSAPSATPTQSPSPTSNVKPPGFYSTGGCVSFPFNLGKNDWRVASIDFCVESVEITQDGGMLITVSWTIHVPANIFVTKRSSAGNMNMYVTDNLGNKYEQFEVGGTAAQQTKMVDGDTVYETLKFPAPLPGADSLTFFDDYNKVFVSGILLTTPIQIYGDLVFKDYPYQLTYRLKLWKEEQGVLVNLELPACQISEMPPGDPAGKLINTAQIGTLTYNIYRSYDKEWSVREYIVTGGLAGMDPARPPAARVTIPYENSETCLLDASEVLANLHAP